VLSAQLKHAVLAGVFAANWPAGQNIQSAVPFVALYLPGVQAVHSPPSGPVYPAKHEQSVTAPEIILAGEYEFAGQLVHETSSPGSEENVFDLQTEQEALPTVALNFPRGQIVQFFSGSPV